MPLEKSSSDAARQQNIEREIAAGKPPKQAVAIGYSVQREAGKKMADPVKTPPVRRREVDNGDLDFLDHIKRFFVGGPDKDPSKSEIVNKGGPGGQRREKGIMDAVDEAVTGAKDDPI